MSARPELNHCRRSRGSQLNAAGGQLTPTGYVSAAVPAVVVGASVILGAALLALLLPSGVVRTTPAQEKVAGSPEAPSTTDAELVAAP
jgi:hypothetical protein